MTRAVVVDDSHFMRTVIADILDGGGYLAVGKTETPPETLEPAFDPVARRLRIYRKANSVSIR